MTGKYDFVIAVMIRLPNVRHTNMGFRRVSRAVNVRRCVVLTAGELGFNGAGRSPPARPGETPAQLSGIRR